MHLCPPTLKKVPPPMCSSRGAKREVGGTDFKWGGRAPLAPPLATFLDQCSPALKNTLFRAYCTPMYACQLWSKYKQASMKRLRAACNNAYRMHYIPRIVSVRPHPVNHCINTFDALLRNNLHRFFKRCIFSSNFFIQSL